MPEEALLDPSIQLALIPVEEITGAVKNLNALWAMLYLSIVTFPVMLLPEFTPPLVMSPK